MGGWAEGCVRGAGNVVESSSSGFGLRRKKGRENAQGDQKSRPPFFFSRDGKEREKER
jgi:hypothetical protein